MSSQNNLYVDNLNGKYVNFNFKHKVNLISGASFEICSFEVYVEYSKECHTKLLLVFQSNEQYLLRTFYSIHNALINFIHENRDTCCDSIFASMV